MSVEETTPEIDIKTVFYSKLDRPTRALMITMVHSKDSGARLDTIVASARDLGLTREEIEKKIEKLREMGLVEQGKLINTGRTEFPQFEIDPGGNRFRLHPDVLNFIFKDVLNMDRPPDLFGVRR